MRTGIELLISTVVTLDYDERAEPLTSGLTALRREIVEYLDTASPGWRTKAAQATCRVHRFVNDVCSGCGAREGDG